MAVAREINKVHAGCEATTSFYEERNYTIKLLEGGGVA